MMSMWHRLNYYAKSNQISFDIKVNTFLYHYKKNMFSMKMIEFHTWISMYPYMSINKCLTFHHILVVKSGFHHNKRKPKCFQVEIISKLFQNSKELNETEMHSILKIISIEIKIKIKWCKDLIINKWMNE